MLTIKIKISSEVLDDVCLDIEERYGVIMTRDYLSQFLKKNENLAVDVYLGDLDDEAVVDSLAYELTGRTWPLYGDTLKVKKTFTNVFRKAVSKKRHITLEEDWRCGVPD